MLGDWKQPIVPRQLTYNAIDFRDETSSHAMANNDSELRSDTKIYINM